MWHLRLTLSTSKPIESFTSHVLILIRLRASDRAIICSPGHSSALDCHEVVRRAGVMKKAASHRPRSNTGNWSLMRAAINFAPRESKEGPRFFLPRARALLIDAARRCCRAQTNSPYTTPYSAAASIVVAVSARPTVLGG